MVRRFESKVNKIIDLVKKHWEIVSYLFWGGMTTLVSWGSYSIFVSILGDKEWNVAVANVLSWICAVVFAYVTNKLWVFNSKSWSVKVILPELIKFLSARVVTGIFEIVSVPLLVELGLNQTIFGIDGMVAKVLVSVVVVLLNYVFSKLFIFKKNK